MGWLSGLFGSGFERSDGESGKVDDVWVRAKTNDSGDVTDILVGREGESDHDHYWNVDSQESAGAAERVDWSGDKDSEDKDSE